MLKLELIDPILKNAIKEDVGAGDITTRGLISPKAHCKAGLQFQEDGVLCGIEIAERVFRIVDPNLRFLPLAKDGEWIEKKREVAYIEGSSASILTAERVALNTLSHLCGIATKTRAFVDKVKGTSAKILDTRKTLPGLRRLEKYAVLTGGGTNHRLGLYDQILIKDNHLRILRNETIPSIVARARKAALKKTVVGIEVKNLKELEHALKARPDYILLDNMKPEMVRECVNLRKRMDLRTDFEVSGGINLQNVMDYAQIGVERISVGGLTHGAASLNISLDIVS